MVRYSAEFVCAKPYSEGNQQVAGFTIPSGVNSLTIATTISGSAPNRPLITLVLPSGAGVSPIVQIDSQYSTTGNKVTVSGVLTAENTVKLNYDLFLVTVNGSNNDYTGPFDEIKPGSTTFIITVSGQNDGIRGNLSYTPRYF
jgi:hypothetical protein